MGMVGVRLGLGLGVWVEMYGPIIDVELFWIPAMIRNKNILVNMHIL